MPCSTSMLAPGFIDHVRDIGLLLKQRLAEIKDRHPEVIAEVRGKGLLIGLRMVPPTPSWSTSLRAEKLLTVGGRRQCVRLLPPLIIGEDEIAEAIARLDRACRGWRRRIRRPAKRRRRMSAATAALPRSDRRADAATLRRHPRRQPRHEGRPRAGRVAATPLAGKTLAMIFEKRRRAPGSRSTSPCASSAARRSCSPAQDMQLGRGETIEDTARVLSRYRRRDHDPHPDHETVAELARQPPCR